MSTMSTPRRARRATAWFATLALAAGVAISAPNDPAHAAYANGSTFMQAWGSGDTRQTQLPLDLRTGLKNVIKISLGTHHGVATTADKKLYAWGDNAHGEGVVPDYLQNLGTIDVAAGNGFNVVLGDDFNARVWGETPFGLDSVPDAAVAVDLIEVAAGTNHALAKSSGGKVFAWGKNDKGQTTVPTAVNQKVAFGLAAGTGFSMVLTSDKKVVVWGDNTSGVLDVPAGLAGKKIAQIAAGARHALALTEDGELFAWGSNAEGALNVPPLAEGDKWVQIAAGNGFSAGVSKDSSTSKVWGSGATDVRQAPAASGSNPTSIAAGGDFLVQGFKRLGISAAPSVTSTGGVFRVGTPIQATHAKFGPTDAVTKTGEWLKVTGNVVTTVGTGMTYTPKVEDMGANIAFRTNASSSDYGIAYADTPQVPVKGTLFASATKPVVTGDAYVGSTLKGTVTSTPEADSYRYDWYADGTYRKTSDARGEYVVQEADLGKKITLLGYADKLGYERINAGPSDPTETVTRAPSFEVQRPPVVRGVPRVGVVLGINPAVVLPQPSQTTYQWYRNGAPIRGATASTYRAAPADAGSTIGVMAALSGPGRSNTAVGSQTVTIAKVTPGISVKTKTGRKAGKKRKVTIVVAVSAAGVPPLGGTITIRDGKKVVKTLTLSKGKRTYIAKLKRGKHTLKVTYNGTTGVAGRSVAKKLKLK